MLSGTRHPLAPGAGRPVAALVSVIALLALLCFPVLAHAEDSSGVQYSDSLPELPKKEGSKHSQTPAHDSKIDNGGGKTPSNSTDPGGSDKGEGNEEDDSSSQQGGVVAGKDGGTGQGNPGGSANDGAKKALSQSGQDAPGKSTAPSDDDGSSPLVPILVAIAVLAAVSVGVVMYRQRRQRRGLTASASPEAN